MRPGPDLVVACPRCGRRARVRTLLSGNTFGARVWTDGKVEAPMLPTHPPIAPCRACGRMFWWPDAVIARSSNEWTGAWLVLGMIGGFFVPVALGASQNWSPLGSFAGGLAFGLARELRWRWRGIRPPSGAQFLEAIAEGLGSTREREVTLRLYVWWAANDPSRAVMAAKDTARLHPDAPRLSGADAANLLRLHELLDPATPEQRLLKAEAARELGDFEGASALLAVEPPDEQAPVAARIRELVGMRNTTVAEVRMRRAGLR